MKNSEYYVIIAEIRGAPAEKLYIKQDGSPDRPTVKAQEADENSLYNEIKKLIGIRQSHAALQSKGDIEFLYAEKDAYPFAYSRRSGDEKILIIINPADRETAFECKYSPKEKLYSFGGDISDNSGNITVPPCFAGYYRV